MNSHERYLFDLQGFLQIPEALDAVTVSTLNEIFDAKIDESVDSEASTHRFLNLLSWGKPYRNLIDNPRLTPYLEAILGPKFRLDHDYADIIRHGTGPIGTKLHGGGTPFDPSQFYTCHNGEIRTGLTVIAYNLKDVNPGDGGFGCVPGSHKSNFPFPDDWRSLDTLAPFMRAVTGPAGTAIIFTEALTHGTLPWRGAGERRTIFFKFSPHAISWSASYYDANQYDDLTDQQCAILEPPNARYPNRKVTTLPVNLSEIK